MFVKNLSINVIATFELREYEEQQEIFDIKFLTKKVLKSKKSLIEYIKVQLDPQRELVKLSLCWNCSEDIVNQYPTIKKSIFKDNGKYFFGSWA